MTTRHTGVPPFSRILPVLALAFASTVSGCYPPYPTLVKKGYTPDQEQTVGVCSPIVSWREGSESWYWGGDIYVPQSGEEPHGWQLPKTTELIFCGLVGDDIRIRYRELIQGTFQLGMWERSVRELTFPVNDKMIVLEEWEIEVVAVDPQSITFIVRNEPLHLRSTGD